jgi:hypothetical protein
MADRSASPADQLGFEALLTEAEGDKHQTQARAADSAPSGNAVT